MVDRRVMTRGGVECVLNDAVVEKLASDLRGDLIATDDRDYDVAKSGSQWTRHWREQDSNPRSPGREKMIPFWRRRSGEGSRRRQEAVPNNQGSGRIKRPEPLLCGDRRFRWLRIELAQARHDLLREQRDVGDRVLMVQEAALTKEQEMAPKRPVVPERD